MATKATAKRSTKKRHVLVATKSRDWCVMAGELASQRGDVVTLRNARMIVYFSSDARGLPGVAKTGPGSGGRVSAAVDRAEVRGVELILDLTAAARQAIEAEPWN